jgi:hypothetical protein
MLLLTLLGARLLVFDKSVEPRALEVEVQASPTSGLASAQLNTEMTSLESGNRQRGT